LYPEYLLLFVFL